jgi:hypothetical protein
VDQHVGDRARERRGDDLGSGRTEHPRQRRLGQNLLAGTYGQLLHDPAGLEAHIAAEAHDIATAQALTRRTTDPVTGELLDVVVARGQRHQALLATILEQLQAANTAFDAPVMRPVDPELITDLRELIRDGHEGARFLRHLARQAPAPSARLYATLLEMMARDSETNVAVLRYVLRRMEEAAA